MSEFAVRAIATACAVLLALVAPAHAQPSTLDPGPLTRAQAFARVRAMTALGRKMFFDPSLSASGRQSCATCHDPARGFAAPGPGPVAMGGPRLHRPGVRAVPSLRYLQAVPPFTLHYFEPEDEGDESIDNGPTGGLTWDGRVDRGRDQARIPLLSPYEMANANPAAVAAALARAPYARAFRRLFGRAIFADPEAAFEAALRSLAAFEQDAATFYPYSSKYDAYLADRATLTAAEARGLAAFDDPRRGNCASCHPSRRANDGEPPQFTDYGFVALGLPRNEAIPANADPAYFDLGLCGPYRTDLAGRADFCGRFRTPGLRNVALRRSFFHNGVIHSLRQAVEFYATRDTDPARWYSRRADGTVAKYDDLPKRYWGNVETGPPFGGKAGGRPALTDGEVDDIVAFLKTLTDGYRPAAP